MFRKEAGKTWDIWQARLGADGMAQLLRHIRTLKTTKTSSKPIEQDLVELYQLRDADLDFINNVLVPHARRYLAILRCTVGDGAYQTVIGSYIGTLLWLNREHWVPAALSWLEVHDAGHPDTAAFFRRLDRLAWLMRIAGRDPVEQERRFRRIATRIKEEAVLANIAQLEIEPKIAAMAKDNLLSRTFYDKTYSRLVLRRLSLLAGSDCGHIDGDQATVEHILPRKPPSGTAWYTAFTNKKAVDQYAHRLGNLAVLTFWENQKAGAKPFPEKCPILAKTRFVLAHQVAKSQDWTPKEIDARSNQLAAALFNSWDMDLTAS